MRWDEARRIAVEVLRPVFKDLGYKNVGKTMWRFRADFIDVVQIYIGKYGDRFTIDLGCHPRKDPNLKNNLKTWDTMFRGRMNELYEFSEISTQELKFLMAQSLEEVERQEINFFNNFKELKNCLEVLNGKINNAESILLLPNPGSNSFLKCTALLERLIEEKKNAPQQGA